MADETIEIVSLVTENTRVRVSSVLNRDSSQYGKKFMFDKNEDTCWNSDQGSPQFVILAFPEEAEVKEIQVQFQGGFVGKECTVEGGPSSNSLTPFHEFYPDDSNTLQWVVVRHWLVVCSVVMLCLGIKKLPLFFLSIVQEE